MCSLFLLSFLTVFCAGVSADVTDVNSIRELKGKSAGTYRFHFEEGTVIYGVYNDRAAGGYLYVWDGTQGLRINGLYEGALKEIIDASPVGRTIKGTVTAIYSPTSNDGCTLMCNTYRDEQCSFDAQLGEAGTITPRAVSVSDIVSAVEKPGDYSMDFAYVTVHGHTLYIDYQKYMYDDNGDRIIMSNPVRVYDNLTAFNDACDGMKGTLTGAVIVNRITDQYGTTVNYSIGVMGDDWFDAESELETPELELDAEGEYKGASYPNVSVTVKNLSMKAGLPAIIDLPFSMTEEHIKNNFGEGTRLYYMDRSAGNHSITASEVTFDLTEWNYAANATAADKAYVIVPQKDITADTRLSFDGVEIQEWQTEGYTYYTSFATGTSIYFKGTFSPKVISGESKYLVYDKETGELVELSSGSEIKGFSGYFEAPAGTEVKVVLNDSDAGTSCDNPITAVEGSGNVLPKNAGTYWYDILPGKAGFVTVASENRELAGGSVKVYETCGSYVALTEAENAFAVRFKVDPASQPRYLMCVTKQADTDADEKFTVTVDDPAEGDSFDNPKGLDIGSISAPEYNGDYYYRLVMSRDGNKFLKINAAQRAVNPSTRFYLYEDGASDKVLAVSDNDKVLRYEMDAEKQYILKLHSAESKAFNFSVIVQDIMPGEALSTAINAVIGENSLKSNGYDVYYCHTMESAGRMGVSVENPVEVMFLGEDGHVIPLYYMDDICQTDAVAAGTVFYIKFSNVTGDTTFNLSEIGTSGIDGMTVQGGVISVNDGKITVSGDTGATVYNMSGVKVAGGNGRYGFDVGKGMYVVVVNGKAVKVTVK